MVQLDQPSKHPTKSSTQDSSVPLTTFQMARTKQVPRRGGKNKVPDNQRASPPVTRNANPNTSAEQATREVLSATVPKESVATTSGQENQFVMPDVSEIQHKYVSSICRHGCWLMKVLFFSRKLQGRRTGPAQTLQINSCD
ncbi:uncharacterized protein ACB058_003056 isoform 2-T2 [Synchiropus picturatus]